jgi:putative Mn2+ efflux pump MntP
VLALVLVAVSLGVSNFAAAIGIGLSGTSARRRFEVGIIFGLFEALMPIIGLVLGHRVVHEPGHAAHWLGGGLLIATGIYGLLISSRLATPETNHDAWHTGRLVLSGLALSIDNLVVGFALGTYHVAVLVAAATIGAVSTTLSLLGLELGSRLGSRTGERAEILGSLVLVGVGISIAASVL